MAATHTDNGEQTRDANDYDIDPTEFEYEGEPCRTRDSSNNYSTTVGRIKGTDLWVSVFSTQVGPSEMSHSINGLGRISTTGVDLDQDTIAETIRDEADGWYIDDGDEEAEAAVEWLTENADTLAEKLVEEWKWGAEEIIGDALYEGVAGVDGTRAWMSHVEEAVVFEVGEVLGAVSKATDYEPADKGEVEWEILATALYDAIGDLRDHWMRPHLEYEVEMEFDAEPWELRAIELQQNSHLPRETARVAALKEADHPNHRIAEQLDIDPSTVTRQMDRARRMGREAEWYVKNGPGL